MILNPIQIFILIIALAAIIKAWRSYANGQLDKRKLIGWTLLWVGGLFVILLPDTTSWLASRVGVGRGVDAIVYLSVVVLFFALFQTSRKVDKLERHLTKLVRAIALNDADKDKLN
jgi:hypothetical protein